MANTSKSAFFTKEEARKLIGQVVRRVPTRLTGDLAVGETILASGSASEVIDVQGAMRVSARFKTSGAGIPLLTLSTTLADGATASVTGTETEAPGAATEGRVTLDLYGENSITVTLEETGGADPMDIEFVDVYIV